MTPGSPLPLRLRLSIRAEGQSRRFEISARPRTTTKLTVNLNSIPALRREKRDRGRGGGGAASLTRLVPQRPRDIMAWPASLIPFRGCQLESGRWCLPETSVGRYTPPFPVRLDLIEKNSGYIGVTPSFERGMISRDFNSFPSFSLSLSLFLSLSFLGDL